MSQHDSKYIENVNKLLYDQALKACRKQVLVFSGELKNKMLSMGVSKPKTAEIIQEAFKGYKTMDIFKKECSEVMYETLEAYLRPSLRQRDILGRLLIELGIIQAYRKQVIFADGSPRDEAAREEFTKGVLPRPLIRYFLVCVRGTISEIDEFKAKPVLYGMENDAMAERKEDLDGIVKEFTQHFKYGKTSTDWPAMYQDIRCRQITFETLSEILETLESMGPQRFLKILSNVQNNNKFPAERTAMKRLFQVNDIKQLTAALSRGHKKLEEELASA